MSAEILAKLGELQATVASIAEKQEEFGKMHTGFRQSVEKHFSGLNGRFDSVDRRLDDLHAVVDEEKTGVDAALSQLTEAKRRTA